MVKKKKSTQKKASTKKNLSLTGWWKELYARDKFISIFILVALVAVIASAIWGSLVVYEKWQFNKAEKALDSLYTDIVAELGEPVSYEKTKSCGYSSAKYSKGDLACSVSCKIDYSETDITQLATSVYSTALTAGYINSVDMPSRYMNIGAYTFDIEFSNVKLECGSTVNTNDDSQYVIISCGSNPLRQVYPLRD